MRDAKRRYRERNREELRRKGRVYAEQRRRQEGIAVQGSAESSANRSRARKPLGAEHGKWKGDQVGYFALHAWVGRHKQRTGICQHCGEIPEPRARRRVGTEWANVSGEYKRDLADWIELCPSCHGKFDMTDDKLRRLRELARQPRELSDETREKLRAAAFRRWDKSRRP